jgi:hypothetical protein
MTIKEGHYGVPEFHHYIKTGPIYFHIRLILSL